MKWAGMYLLGFVVLVGGLMAALWKLGILQRIGTAWTLIGLAILIGIGIMISVSNSGRKENIEIDSKGPSSLPLCHPRSLVNRSSATARGWSPRIETAAAIR